MRQDLTKSLITAKSWLVNIPKHRSSRLLSIAAILTLLGCTTVLLATPAHSERGTTGGLPIKPMASTSAAQSIFDPNTIEGEVITLRRWGFEPAAIQRKPGKVVLSVDNRSGLEAVTFRLDQVGGAQLRSVNVSDGQLDWNELLDLAPGNYVLTEVNHPEWSCSITVVSQ